MRFFGLASCLVLVACSSSSSPTPGPATDADASADVGVDVGLDVGLDVADTPTTPKTDYLILAADPLTASAKRFADYRTAKGQNVELTMISTLITGKNATEAASAIKA